MSVDSKNFTSIDLLSADSYYASVAISFSVYLVPNNAFTKVEIVNRWVG